MAADRKPLNAMTLTEYWEAVEKMISTLEEKEKNDAEFAKEADKDEVYKLAKKVLKEMAASGKKLEEASWGLLSLGMRMIAAREQFKNSDKLPEIKGAASFELVDQYQRLLEHLGQEKVKSTGLLQGGLEKPKGGQPKSGYQDAKDSAEALKKAIEEYKNPSEKKSKEVRPLISASTEEERKLAKEYGELIKFKSKLKKLKGKDEEKLDSFETTSLYESIQLRLPDDLKVSELEDVTKLKDLETKLETLKQAEKKANEPIKDIMKFYKGIEPNLSQESKTVWEQQHITWGWRMNENNRSVLKATLKKEIKICEEQIRKIKTDKTEQQPGLSPFVAARDALLIATNRTREHQKKQLDTYGARRVFDDYIKNSLKVEDPDFVEKLSVQCVALFDVGCSLYQLQFFMRLRDYEKKSGNNVTQQINELLDGKALREVLTSLKKSPAFLNEKSLNLFKRATPETKLEQDLRDIANKYSKDRNKNKTLPRKTQYQYDSTSEKLKTLATKSQMIPLGKTKG
jgi:hypothetical protein